MDEPIEQVDSTAQRPEKDAAGGSVDRYRRPPLRSFRKSQAMDADPLAVHLQVTAAVGALKLPVIDAASGKQVIATDGTPQFVWQAVSLTEMIASCRAIMNYLYPKLMLLRFPARKVAR